MTKTQTTISIEYDTYQAIVKLAGLHKSSFAAEVQAACEAYAKAQEQTEARGRKGGR